MAFQDSDHFRALGGKTAGDRLPGEQVEEAERQTRCRRDAHFIHLFGRRVAAVQNNVSDRNVIQSFLRKAAKSKQHQLNESLVRQAAWTL